MSVNLQLELKKIRILIFFYLNLKKADTERTFKISNKKMYRYGKCKTKEKLYLNDNDMD